MTTRRGETAIAVAIVATFTLVRLALLIVREPFFDELFTVWLAKKPLTEILPALRFDSGPPLYYFLARIPDVTALRVLSLVFAFVPLAILLARKSYAAAALLAVYPPAALYAVDARPYALCGTLIAIGVLLLDDDRPYLAALAILAAAFTHYLGALFLPALLPRHWRAFAIACLLFLPGIWLATQQPAEATAWMEGGHWLAPLKSLAFVGDYPESLLAPPPLSLMILSAALVIAAVVRSWRYAPFVLVPVLLAIGFALIGRNVYVPLRFEAVLAVPLVLWIANVGRASARPVGLKSDLHFAAIGAIGLYVLIAGIVDHAHRPAEPFAAAAREAIARAGAGEAIVAVGYCYLPAVTSTDRPILAFPAEQARHPGWRSNVAPVPLHELPRSFVVVAERSAPELFAIRRTRRGEVLFANDAAVVARVNFQP